jgi:hypothetical protein
MEDRVRSKTKTKEASDKAVLASVKKEMARPRMSESAQIEAKRQRQAKPSQRA